MKEDVFMKKTILFIMLSLMLICFGCISANAASESDLTYTINDNQAIITDCKTSAIGELVIPNTLGGYPVTSIGGDAFEDCNNLVSVTIPDSVTNIGSHAFDGCSGLISIRMPNSLTNMGAGAFVSCSSLANITIPNGVTSIGYATFWGCSGLASVTIPESVTSIGDLAFYGCSSLTKLTVGKGVVVIPKGAFEGSDKLEYIVLPVETKYIRNDAFNGCSNIKTIFYEGNELQWNDIIFYTGNENITNARIIYNSTKKNYKFETNCDKSLDGITDYAIFIMPIIENDGMILTGWYDNESLSGNPVTFPYYGGATTLYAAWTERTGKTFDDAFIVKANQEYTVSTTKSGQLVYFEFVPNSSKEYRFYSTGSKDTYGCLYNSNKSQLTSNDDDGDGDNFYISYNLTAGQTYYVATKFYSGTGTFTFVVEEPMDYRINSVTIKDMSGNELSAIPTGTFLATVSFTNVSSSADTVIILAQYTNDGAFKGLMYIQTEDVPIGSTIKLSIPVYNLKGEVAKLNAFCWESFGSLIPMGNSISFPTE